MHVGAQETSVAGEVVAEHAVQQADERARQSGGRREGRTDVREGAVEGAEQEAVDAPHAGVDAVADGIVGEAGDASGGHLRGQAERRVGDRSVHVLGDVGGERDAVAGQTQGAPQVGEALAGVLGRVVGSHAGRDRVPEFQRRG
jgi:hypothetical protein